MRLSPVSRLSSLLLVGFLGVLAVGAASPPNAAHAQIYDANADFTPASAGNPNGVWSYGYTTTLGGTFIPFGEFINDGTLLTWRTNIGLGTPAWFKNLSGVNQVNNSLAPGQTALHGGPNGEFAVLRFTAPSAGIYNYDLEYFPGDSGNTDIYLLQSSNAADPLFSDLITTGPGSFSFDGLSLSQNETLDLVVGNANDGFTFDTTPVNLQVEAVPAVAPEPATGALLATGLLILGGVITARRRRRA